MLTLAVIATSKKKKTYAEIWVNTFSIGENWTVLTLSWIEEEESIANNLKTSEKKSRDQISFHNAEMHITCRRNIGLLPNISVFSTTFLNELLGLFFVCLFVCLIWLFTSQSTILQLCRDGSSWVEPVLS